MMIEIDRMTSIDKNTKDAEEEDDKEKTGRKNDVTDSDDTTVN